MNTKTALRQNGYSVAANGHIEFYRHKERTDEHTCAIFFTLARDCDSKADHELIDRLIEFVGEPRALLGRGTANAEDSATAVLLFRRGAHPAKPNISGHQGDVFKLATRDGRTRFRIMVLSEGDDLGLNVSAFKWEKDRSPLDVGVWQLPILTSEAAKAVINEAFRLDCSWASQVEKDLADAQRMEDIRSGKIVLETDEARQVAEDAAIVERYKDAVFGQFDELRQIVHGARYRVAKRAAEAATAATAA